MQIHALCLIKDEADVIEECLVAALGWCDHIYVFDNGSTDGTWELVQELAALHPAIVPFKQDPVVFTDGIRADIFNQYQDRVAAGDWWCRLDADEFYIDDPRLFLAKVPGGQDVVWTASFSYYFTDKDAEAYRSDPGTYAKAPVQERLRYYVNHWSEVRFFRHRPGLKWSRADGGFPSSTWAARPYPVRIWVKHFAYRSPEQIDRRLLARQPAIDAGEFAHEAVADWSAAVASVRTTREGFERTGKEFAGGGWESRVVESASFDYDALDRRLVVNEALMPPILAPLTGWRKVKASAEFRFGQVKRMARQRWHR